MRQVAIVLVYYWTNFAEVDPTLKPQRRNFTCLQDTFLHGECCVWADHLIDFFLNALRDCLPLCGINRPKQMTHAVWISVDSTLTQCLVSVTQPKRDVDPMSIYCWSTVCDAGPTLNKHLASISCVLGDTTHTDKKMITAPPNNYLSAIENEDHLQIIVILFF